MKLSIKCIKNDRHRLSVHGGGIYCESCDDYLNNNLIELIGIECIAEGKKRMKEEFRHLLGV